MNVFDLTGIEQKEIFESVLVSTRMLLATLEGIYGRNAGEGLNRKKKW